MGRRPTEEPRPSSRRLLEAAPKMGRRPTEEEGRRPDGGPERRQLAADLRPDQPAAGEDFTYCEPKARGRRPEDPAEGGRGRSPPGL